MVHLQRLVEIMLNKPLFFWKIAVSNLFEYSPENYMNEIVHPSFLNSAFMLKFFIMSTDTDLYSNNYM
jgi:hypothetical protein